MPDPIKIFISSPSDVRPERLIAERVIARLDREFAHYFAIEALLWEHEPLVAAHHFQDSQNIPPPHTADIAIVILWSRLGVMLPQDKFVGAVSGKRPVTGTEWEFEDAVAAYRASHRPIPLLYRKTASITASLDDDAKLEQSRAQKKLVDEFLKTWFQGEGDTYVAASTTFVDETSFEEKLESDLRKLLQRRLEGKGSSSDAAPRPIRWHESSPFRGLESFDLKHAAVFFGRTRARNELRTILARRAERGCAFVLVMGPSGSGKSSLVKAGLLPDLLLPGMVGNVALCRYAIVRPSQAGGGPLDALVQAMMAPTALPELSDLRYTAQRLGEQLRRSHDQAVFAVEQGLARAAEKEKLTKIATARLVLIVDQMEEIFTDESVTTGERDSFVAALDALARCDHVWVVGTMRSDFFERLAAVPALNALSDGDGRYLLVPPTEAEIRQMIRHPALEAGLYFDIDRNDGTSLDDVIIGAAAHPDSLPLLEYLLDELWKRRDGQTLTFKAYEEIGGLEGSLGRRAQEEYENLPASVQAALPAVLRSLVTVGQSRHGRVSARSPLLSTFPPGTPGRTLVDRFASSEVRLFVIDGERVRVAHEALLTHWPLATRLIGEAWTDLQLRARMEQSAAGWNEAPETDRESFLLRPGLPLTEAEDLQARLGMELDELVRDFIKASGDLARSDQRRRSIRQKVLLATTSSAALLFLGLGVFAAINWYAAKRSLDAAAHAISTLVEATSDVVQPIAQLDAVQALVNETRRVIATFGDVSDDPRLAVQRARTLLVLAEIEEARGRIDAMQRDAKEALASIDALATRGNLEARLERVRGQRLIGWAYAQENKKEQARQQYEAAIADLNTMIKSADEPLQKRMRRSHAELHQYLGDVLLNQFNDPANALAAYTESHKTRLELQATGQVGPRGEDDVAWAENKLADVQVRLGQDDQALTWFFSARRRLEALGDRLWDNVTWPHHLALICTNIGLAQTRRGRYRDAVAAYDDSHRLLEEIIRRDPRNTSRLSALGWSYDSHGDALHRWAAEERDRERLVLARTAFTRALAIRGAVANASPGNALLQLGVASTRANLAAVNGLLKQWDEDYKSAAADFEEAATLATQTYVVHIHQYARTDSLMRIVDLTEAAAANYAKAGNVEEGKRVLRGLVGLIETHKAKINEPIYTLLQKRLQSRLDALTRP